MPEEVRLNITVEEKGTPEKPTEGKPSPPSVSTPDSLEKMQKEWNQLFETGRFRLGKQTEKFQELIGRKLPPPEEGPREKPRTPEWVQRRRGILQKRRKAKGEREQRQRETARQPPRPPPRPPPVIEPPRPPPGVLSRVGASLAPALRSAIPAFTGSGITAATGSTTLGGLAGTGVGQLAAAAGPVGLAFGGVALAGVALVEVFKKLWNITGEAAESIKEYSPQVAVAGARAEIAMHMAMLRRARVAGKELAAVTTAESRLEIAIEGLKTTIVREIAPNIVDILLVIQGGVELLESASKGVGDTVEILKTLIDKYPILLAAIGALSPTTFVLTKIAKRLKQLADDANKKRDAKMAAEEQSVLEFFGISDTPWVRGLSEKAGRGFREGLEETFENIGPAPRNLPIGM